MPTATKALSHAAGQYLEARLEQGAKDLTQRLETGLPALRPHLPKPHLPKPRLPKAKLPKPHLPGGRSAGATRDKPLTIVEDLVIGAPVDVAYEHWTRFRETPQWSRGVQEVEEIDQDTTRWRARMLWAERRWQATTVEEVPEQRVAWRSDNGSTHLRGVVTFHPLAEDATLLLLVLEYRPTGVLEHLGGLVRAQGRRVRLDLKRFRAFVTWQDHPDEGEDEARDEAQGDGQDETRTKARAESRDEDGDEDGDEQ